MLFPSFFNAGPATYEIEQSLRFDGSSYFSRTYSSAGNRKTFTISVWVKRAQGGNSFTNERMFGAYDGGGSQFAFGFYGNGAQTELHYDQGYTGPGSGYAYTNAQYRDNSAWYHLVYVADYSNSTAADRWRFYVNGERITSFRQTSAVVNGNASWNYQGNHYIGRLASSNTNHFKGYMAELHILDGTAVTNADDFGETNAQGVWVPKKVSGVTYGTNGVYLKFDPTATNGIGHDHSGNGNHWTASGFNTTEGNGSYAIDCSTVSGGGSFARAFDGNISTGVGSENFSGEIWTWEPATAYPYSTSVEIYGGEAAYDQARINGGSWQALNGGWKTLASGSGSITKIEVRDSRGNAAASFNAFRVDGTFLIDNLFNSDSDVVKDTPTSNYCTWNPISNNGVTLANGNLDTSSGSTGNCRGTIAVTSGKYYWEYSRIVTGTGTPFVMGLCEADGYSPTGHDNWTRGVYFYTDGSGNGEVRYYENGSRVTASTVTVPTSMRRFFTRDVLQVAFDADSGKVWFGKNGVYLDNAGGTTGNPGAGTGATITLQGTDIPISPMRDHAGVAISAKANFGQHDFVFDPPTGFKALNTSNLPAPTVKDGSDYFNTVLWTGNATARDITTGHNSNFTWIKHRNSAENHNIYDILRGAGLRLESNSNSGETSYSDRLTAFNTDGFSLGTGYNNTNGTTYVGWSWAGGGSGSSNTDGTITSTVSASPSSGFSIGTFTGTGSPGSIGHGLGVAPKFILIKRTNVSGNSWAVYHDSVGTNKQLLLNSTNSAGNDIYGFPSAPSSTVINVGSGAQMDTNQVGAHVFYAWSEVEGYSKFGSYTGNGSTDGPFVYCGFKPAFLLLKRTDSTSAWFMLDTTRDPNNVSDSYLVADSNIAEGTYTSVDFLSNGFKARNPSSSFNTSGATHIFMAFASNPFGGDGVSPATAR